MIIGLDNESRFAASPRCRLLVVKTTERCNLNCSYCYMFNGGDRSYLTRPPVMPREVVEAMMQRAGAHCRRHGLRDFTFVLHGGEPMVAKPAFYRHFVSTARRALGPAVTPRFAMQTNGTLMTEAWCDLFLELDIKLSFSLDGPRAMNDRHRLDRRGRGSFDRVLAGWELARSKGLQPGLLLVIDVDSDPEEVYRFIKQLGPPTVDFLFPDATYDKPPAGYENGIDATRYADWLIAVFRCWTADNSEALKIRMFLQIMRSLMGINEGYDVLGTGSIEVLVVESDGEIQPLDGLRYCADGIANTPYNVLADELDDAYDIPLIRLYHDAHEALCATCRGCAIKDVCGGGFLPHRYRATNGFDNPSLYCRDLTKLIFTVHEWLLTQLPPAAVEELNLARLRPAVTVRA